MQLYVIFAALIGLAVASLADITLKPARRHDALTRRSNEMFLVEKVELTYAEGMPLLFLYDCVYALTGTNFH